MDFDCIHNFVEIINYGLNLILLIVNARSKLSYKLEACLDYSKHSCWT